MNERILVVQLGARHNYMLPIVMENLGILQGFYTDMCADRGAGRVARLGIRQARWLPSVFDSLAARKLPDAVLRKTKTFDRATLKHLLWLRSCRSIEEKYLAQRQFDTEIGLDMVRAGFKDATHIYSVFGEAGPFIAAAKQRGIKIITDVIIALSTEEIVLAEHRHFQDWGNAPLDQKRVMGPDFRPASSVTDYTDLFVCPSEFVRGDLVQRWGVDPLRTAVVPYSVGPSWHGIDQGERFDIGQILFVGTADLRKGIHYLAMASEILASRGRNYRIRVAGHAEESVRSKPACRRLEFLGRIPRSNIREEFRRADIFVLPSLSEGSATVIYEALASGVPVVTTPAAGSVVRHGVDGFIVPERNPEALADALESLVQDRDLRTRMANSAKLRAEEFSWVTYGKRIAEALKALQEIEKREPEARGVQAALDTSAAR
jgi:glycosyltransferase involved in cell wall biosynthesis